MPKRSRPRILLVEDDPSQLALLEKALRREEFNVYTSRDLESAIRLAAEETFAVAVVDLDLNGESGLEFASAISRSLAKTRVIIYTAYSTLESARDGLNLGLFAYVEKLSDFSHLIEHVHRAATAYLNDTLVDARKEIVLQLQLLEAVDQGIVATNNEGSVIFWNHYAENLSGVSRNDSIGNQLFNYLTLNEVDRRSAMACMRLGKCWQGECEISESPHSIDSRTPAYHVCERIPVRLILSPITNMRGKVAGAVGTFRDITVEKANEAKLSNRARLLSISAELSRYAVTANDRNLFLEMAIEKLAVGFPLILCRVLLQTTPHEPLTTIAFFENGIRNSDVPLLNRNPEVLPEQIIVLLPEDATSWTPLNRFVDNENTVAIQGFRFPFFQDAHSFGFIEGYFGKPRLISDDDFDFIQSMASLVTAVLQRNRASRLWQSLFDKSGDAVMITDEHGRYLDVNRSACRLLGYSKQELSKKTIADLVKQDSPSLSRETAVTQKMADASRSEIVLARKDEAAIIAKIETISNILPGINLSIIRDLTEKKRSDQVISFQKDQLSHIQRLATMGELAGFLAHEINQSLGAIGLLTGGLIINCQKTKTSPGETLEILERINRAAIKAGSVVNRLRRFVTPNLYEPTRVDANEVLRDTINSLKVYSDSFGAVIRTNLQAELPLLRADAIRLEQVFVNLIRNAFEAMSALAKQDKYVEIETHTEGNNVIVTIRDNGPAISEEQFAKLLTPYVTTKTGGLGIGLCISRSIIEQHNGTLTMKRLSPNGIAGIVSLPIGATLKRDS